MRFVIATHGHCFDGLASAVLFTRLLREVGPACEYEYRACGYGIGQLKADDELLTGDQNAILDYRFYPSHRLSWYFDHHRTAFQEPAHRDIFEQRRQNGHGRYFFDASYSSCTKFIADIARNTFDVSDALLDELVHWADVVDAARFSSAEEAIDRSNPVMRLVSVVEHYGDDAFVSRLVGQLLQRPLSEVAASTDIEEKYTPLGKKHERFVERVKSKSERRGRVVFCDLSDSVLESVGKFVTYALYPDSVYSVILGLLKSGAKISVGYNPWCGARLDADISQICARYGGGGHPVVGGISFKTSDLERARQVARQIADELNR